MDNEKIVGDERYTFINEKTIYKVDRQGKPDKDGNEYRLINELEDGYIVYISPVDPSQPNANYFIHKKYFVLAKH